MEETIELVQGGRITINLGINYGEMKIEDEDGNYTVAMTVTDAANLMVAIKKLLS